MNEQKIILEAETLLKNVPRNSPYYPKGDRHEP